MPSLSSLMSHSKFSVLLTLLFALTSDVYAAQEIIGGSTDSHSTAPPQELKSSSTTTKHTPYTKSIIHKIIVKKSNKNFDKIISNLKYTSKIDYKNYVLLSVHDSHYKKFNTNFKNEIILRDELNIINLQNYSIDTTQKLPDIPDGLQIKKITNKQLQLIQFTGPIKPIWRSAFEENSNIISFLTSNTLLVWIKNETLSSLLKEKRLKGAVQWTGIYQPAYKLKKGLEISGENEITLNIHLVTHKDSSKTIQRIIRLAKEVPLAASTYNTHTYIRVVTARSNIQHLAQIEDVFFIEEFVKGVALGEKQAMISAQRTTFTAANGDASNTALCGETNQCEIPLDPVSNGYLNWFNSKFDMIADPSKFTSFTIDIADTGIDGGQTNEINLHPDFLLGGTGTTSRITTATNYGTTISAMPHDFTGHGTMIASIISGFNNGNINLSAVAGPDNHVDTDNAGFHFGLGIAPYARIVNSRIFTETTTPVYDPIGNTDNTGVHVVNAGYDITPQLNLTQASNNAVISNHSWGAPAISPAYDSDSAKFDQHIYDNDNNPLNGLQQGMTIVSAAGNLGFSGTYLASSLVGKGSTSKNSIVVGGTESNELTPDHTAGIPGTSDVPPSIFCTGQYYHLGNDANDMYFQSSRGPTADGRFKPDLVVPSARVYGAAPQSPQYQTYANAKSDLIIAGSADHCRWPYFQLSTPQHNLYRRDRGTSFAAPVVSGAAALLHQWFIDKTNDGTGLHSNLLTPSPAMTKAWLMNTTTYLTSPQANDDLPSNTQGMGRLNIDRALDSQPRIIRDQLFNITNIDDTYTLTGAVANNDDFRVTLVWTDPAGNTLTADSEKKLVNNLDLNVTIGGATYAGNSFSGAISQSTGPAIGTQCDDGIEHDCYNNVESVWLPAQTANTSFTITVDASDIGELVSSSQNFALVIYNGTFQTPLSNSLGTVMEDSIGNNLTAAALANTPLDNNSLSIIPPISTTAGSVSISAGTLLFDATGFDNLSAAGTDGTATITYTVTDGYGATVTATADVSITGSNDEPIASNDGSLASPLTVSESTAESTGFVIDVLSNDTDIDGTIDASTVNITSVPTFGSAIVNIDGTITFFADPDYVGTSQLNYTVNDNNGDTSNIATVYINVTPSNDTPSITAPTTTLFLLQNTSLVFSPADTILIDDVDVDLSTGIFDVTVSVPAPGNGTFNAIGATAGNNTNSISFSGNLNVVNTALATLSYTGNLGVTGTETVTIEVDDNGFSGDVDEPTMASSNFDITLTANAPPILELDSNDNNRPPLNNVDFENTFDLGLGTPIEIAEGTTITDIDTSSPVSVVVTLTNPLDGSDESLTIGGSTSGVTGNIAFLYSAATLTLSANAGATPSNTEYATAIDLIRYTNVSTTPDTVNRIINITVNDGVGMDSATSTIDFQRRPVDIALVLDTSGSMQQLVDGTTRLQLLKDAVELFLQTWDGFDIAEDRLSTIYFNTNISSFPALLAMEPFAANWIAHNTDIASQTQGGWTSFGAGLQTAIETLNAAPAGAFNRKPVVITFTDGQQNGSPMVMRPGSNYLSGDPVPPLDAATPYQVLDASIGEMVDDGFSVRTLSGLSQASPAISLTSTDTPINIHTIGTGVSGSNLEAMLSKLAANTGGEDYFATPADFISVGGMPSPLQDHFMTTLVSSLSETSLEMVGRVFSQLPAITKSKRYKFRLNNATQRASFILSWNKNESLDQLAFQLKTPQGNFIPVQTSGIDIRSSDYYFIVHLDFPLISRFGPILPGGEWEMILQRKHNLVTPISSSLTAIIPPTTNPVDYSIWVLEDESDVKDKIKLDKPRYNVGDAILLTTRITDLAKPVKTLSVIANISAPRLGLGSYLANNYLSSNKKSSNPSALDAPQTRYDKNLSRLLNMDSIPKDIVPITTGIRLRDDGKQGDKVANDGIFSALYTDTKVPGSYRFDIQVRGQLPHSGVISRQSSITVVTEFDRVDISKSKLKYSDIDPLVQIKNANKQLLITPTDQFGNLLGPGKSQLIRINIENGKRVNKLQDLGDGSYVQYLSVSDLFTNPSISIDAPGLSMFPVVTEDKITLIEWLLIIFLLVIIFFLLIKLIYMLFRR